MEDKIIQMFQNALGALPLYEAAEGFILAHFPDVVRKVDKTQVGFKTKYGFAFLSPPYRRKKDWPREYVMLTFGLDHPLDSPRFAVVTEAQPNRWTHHILVDSPAVLDDEVLGWLQQAYVFSLR